MCDNSHQIDKYQSELTLNGSCIDKLQTFGTTAGNEKMVAMSAKDMACFEVSISDMKYEKIAILVVKC